VSYLPLAVQKSIEEQRNRTMILKKTLLAKKTFRMEKENILKPFFKV